MLHNSWLCWFNSISTGKARKGLGATDVQIEQLALLKFIQGLLVSVHTEAHGHFDLQREMSSNEGQ